MPWNQLVVTVYYVDIRHSDSGIVNNVHCCIKAVQDSNACRGFHGDCLCFPGGSIQGYCLLHVFCSESCNPHCSPIQSKCMGSFEPFLSQHLIKNILREVFLVPERANWRSVLIQWNLGIRDTQGTVKNCPQFWGGLISQVHLWVLNGPRDWSSCP